jgi:hypothetical protein
MSDDPISAPRFPETLIAKPPRSWKALTVSPAASATRREVTAAWKRGLLAINGIVVHSVVTLAALASFELIHSFVKYMTHDEGLIFLNGSAFQFDSRWLFDVGDFSLIAALLFRGIVEITDAYRGRNNG